MSPIVGVWAIPLVRNNPSNRLIVVVLRIQIEVQRIAVGVLNLIRNGPKQR